MRISDWSSDVCSSDLIQPQRDFDVGQRFVAAAEIEQGIAAVAVAGRILGLELDHLPIVGERALGLTEFQEGVAAAEEGPVVGGSELDRLVEIRRSEEHTSELQSLMRNSYAGVCLKTKNI